MPNGNQHRRFLIVEDPFVRSFMCFLLLRHGYDVIEAELAEALEIIRKREIPLGLLITNQPQPFAEAGRDLALLYVAALPDETLARPFYRWRTLRKPFQPKELLGVVQELTAKT